MKFVIGAPKQQRRFREEHQLFLEKLPNLLDVVKAAFTRRLTVTKTSGAFGVFPQL